MPATPEHPPRLTPRQQQALDFITAHLARHGSPPTYREIGDHMGLASTNAVDVHVQALCRKGLLKIRRGKARSMQPTRRPRGSMARLVAGVRQVGAALGVELGAAGEPLPTDWIARLTEAAQREAAHG